MNPHEILEELDRLDVTIWWEERTSASRTPLIRFDTGKVPPELAEQIRMHSDELHKIMRVEHSKTPGLQVRKPRPPRGAP